MFTGIVEETGIFKGIKSGNRSGKVSIGAKKVLEDVHLGDSIAVNGICLTVTSFTETMFTADVMPETWQRSSIGKLSPGNAVNLERAMAADGRFGGHIVSGHIDGTGKIKSIEKEEIAIRLTIEASENILRYIIEKGSVTIDGISLTVVRVTDSDFAVSVIPHTFSRTNLREKQVGSTVNLENDCVGKYIEKFLITPKTTSKEKKISGLTEGFLMENGFL